MDGRDEPKLKKGPLMTHFLITDENPDGHKLEDILRKIRSDIIHRQVKIIDDDNPVAQKIVANNIVILNHLSESIALAESSTLMLDKSFGPSADGKPRIGVE